MDAKTMAGKDNGVQGRIRRKFPKATFVHCASHIMNLVVNYLNSVLNVRNTCGTIKAIIKYFGDSPRRCKLIPTVPLLSNQVMFIIYNLSSDYFKDLRYFRASHPDDRGCQH